jgi:cyclophilin family peptidyl-prolyl cis-trans isomerase
MQPIPSILTMLFSILMPAKIWYAPTQPLNFTVQTTGEVTLVLTDFAGKPLEAKAPALVAGGKEVNVREIYPQLAKSGTYVLFAVPKDKPLPEFIGTPAVIEVRSDRRPGMPEEPVVIKIEPLRYVVMSTDAGDITMVFYYDIAPNTTSAIQTLVDQSFYDGLTFHRIVPGFVIQGGDPVGTGIGGPGFNVGAEFTDRKHEEGTLSMARNGDPMEQQGLKPRCEYANSAGSQFFICLGATPFLDGKYTAFGKVVEGLDVVKAIAAVPLVDARAGKPEKAPLIKKAVVKPVTAEKNPYAAVLNMAKPAAK